MRTTLLICIAGAACCWSLPLCGCRSATKPPQSPTTQPASAAQAGTPTATPTGGEPAAVESPDQAAQVAALKKELVAAEKKARQADGESKYYQGQLEDERKATAAVEAKLKSLQSTLAALRARLWESGDADWVSRTEAETFATKTDVKELSDAKAVGGKALLFDKRSSAIETELAVRPGTYLVVPVGRAPNGGDHDALDLTVKPVDKATGEIDVQQRVFFDSKWEEFREASNVPQITVAQEGKLKVVLKVDEETGAIVDRVEIRVFMPK